MPNVEFSVYSQKHPINLNIRFYHNKIDCNTKSNIFVFEKDYRFKKIAKGKKSSRVVEIFNKDIKANTEILKQMVLEQFTLDFPKGMILDSNWLKKIINEFHEKPSGEDDMKYYFVPLFKDFIRDKEKTVSPTTGKVPSKRTIQKYHCNLNHVINYEIHNGKKLKTQDLDLGFHKDFCYYFKEVLNNGNTTLNKFFTQIKEIVSYAEVKGFKINPETKSPKFTIKKDETIDTYLSVEELNKLYEFDLQDERLENVRDLFIAGAWTGLRISDLKNINKFDMSNGRLKVPNIQKTSTFVEIPIHPQFEAILKKRNGVFHTISPQKFNIYIKEVCEKVGFNEIILGKLEDPITKKKEVGLFPKYKLIASHTMRRCFCTNHYGKLPDKTIMAISRHRSHAQFLEYVKTTSKEQVEIFEKYWQEQEN